MSAGEGVFTSRADTDSFEPYDAGVVHWLRRERTEAGELWAGIWSVRPDELAPGSPHVSTHDETFHVLEGFLRIEVEDGPVLELGAGDLVSLRRGTRARWTILTPVREFFVYV